MPARPAARRPQLLADAEAQDFIVLEDDYEVEMGYFEPPSPALKSFNRNDRVLCGGSFPKSLFPGPCLGCFVDPGGQGRNRHPDDYRTGRF